MHKSSIFFLTAITMALFLAACGDKDDNKETPESTKSTAHTKIDNTDFKNIISCKRYKKSR